MSNKPRLLSLQGELFLAKVINQTVGSYFSVGNMPALKLKINTKKIEHFDSRYGQRAKDATLYKDTGVEIDGELEEVNKTNLAIVVSGRTIEIPEKQITDVSLGMVQPDQMIDLKYRNLSEVKFTDEQSVAIDSSKYTLDATFGTVIFNEAVTGVIQWSGVAGEVTRTTMVTDLDKEYSALFKGVDTFTGDKVVLEIWRMQFSPETEFDLINEDFAKYKLTGEALADNSKANDAELSVFGHIERFTLAN